jgi:MutS domain V
MTDAGPQDRDDGRPFSAPRDAYLRREHEARAARDDAHRTSTRLGTLRLITFLAAAVALVLFDAWRGTPAHAALGAGVLLVFAFGVEVAVHRRVRRRVRWHEQLRLLAHEGTLRLERRWEDLDRVLPAAERTDEIAPQDHPFARDLDVTGIASLVRLMGPVTSERGRAVLRRWLLEPGTPDAALERQLAARELAPALEIRTTFAAHGRIDGPTDTGTVEPFLRWAEEAPGSLSSPWLRLAAYGLPLTTVGLVLGDLLLGWGPIWMAPAALQSWVLYRHSRRFSGDLAVVEESGASLRACVPQLRVIERQAAEAPALLRIAARIGSGDEAATARLASLVRLLDSVASRRNLAYLALDLVFLLDVHLTLALDRWRARSGHAVRGWLEALGEWEAQAALASLAHDHPDWCFPRLVQDGATVLRAKALGHPLLPPATCVRNDVDVGPPGSFLLVTGSNMSGKSTLLRALGVNAVLAAAGGPACADSLELPPLRVFTSMHVEESLAQGVSLFMAELLRIRGIVRAADRPGPVVLYLLDEILHGTNTAERQVAARAVIRHLLAAGAIGAVSTHDLTLAQAADLEAAACPVHFREQVEQHGGKTRLTFDYRLRPGLATTTNALKLLEAVGLGGLPLKEDRAPEA